MILAKQEEYKKEIKAEIKKKIEEGERGKKKMEWKMGNLENTKKKKKKG